MSEDKLLPGLRVLGERARCGPRAAGASRVGRVRSGAHKSGGRARSTLARREWARRGRAHELLSLKGRPCALGGRRRTVAQLVHYARVFSAKYCAN